MSEVDRDALDSVMLEVERLIGRMGLFLEGGDFKTIIQLCEAVISTIEEVELD